jgi:hypothetical protein
MFTIYRFKLAFGSHVVTNTMSDNRRERLDG